MSAEVAPGAVVGVVPPLLPVLAGTVVGVVPPLLPVLAGVIVATGLALPVLPTPDDLLLLVNRYAPPAIAAMRIRPARIIAGPIELFAGGAITGAFIE